MIRAIEDEHVDFALSKFRNVRPLLQAHHLRELNLVKMLCRARSSKTEHFGDANVNETLKYMRFLPSNC